MSKSKLLSSTVLSGLILFSVASYGYADDAVNSNHSTITNWNPGQAALPAIATGTGSATLVATGITNTTDNGSDGLLGESVSGPITILNIKEYEDGSASYSGPALITTAGNNANGISAVSTSGTVDIRHNGEITTKGSNSAGIRSDGGSVINIDTTDGIIETLGNNAYGIVADPNASTIDIIIRSGEIVTGAEDRSTGDYAHGIRAGSSKPDNQHGDFNVNIDIIAVGDITVRGDGANGIFATSSMTGDATIKIDSVQSHITTSGESDDVNGMMLGHGIYVMGGDGPVTVTAGNISVLGSYGSGIKATNNGSGTILVKTVEDTVILTQGAGSGIYATSAGGGNIEVDVRGGVLTKGDLSHGIEADALNWIPFFPSGDVEVFQGSNSFINVSGRASFGIFAAGGNSEVGVAGSVVSEGEFGVGVFALAPQNNVITIDGSAAVIGGWQGQSSDFWNGLSPSKASGVLFVGNDSKIKNSGLISALSDRAIYDGSLLPEFSGDFSGDVSIENAGQITGYLDMASTGESHFQNLSGGIFETRHFADTDGDGERDTKAVAFNDFGNVNSTFMNDAGAMVKLGAVIGEKDVDDTSYYQAKTGIDNRELDAGFYDLNREGVIQAQMLNLGSFSNAGAIDLRGTAVGNTLVMTNSVLAAETGTGKFVSEGGSLYLNTILNGGMSPAGTTDSMSDMLIVDEAALGEGGATTIHITQVNKGGDALTGGNGIQLVEVRNKEASEADVFGLKGDYVHEGAETIGDGAYAYKLYHNGIGDDVADGNWYLRSQLSEVVPEDPLYTGGVPIYEAYPQFLLGLNGLPTLQQRVGNRYWNNAGNKVLSQGADAIEAYAPAEEAGVLIEENAVWGRIEGSHTKIKSKTSTSGTDYDYNTFKIQAGIDGMLHETDDGKLIGGVTVHYANGKANISSVHGDGDIKTNGYGFGGTLTWYGESGFYVDNQAQLTWYDSDLNSDLLDSSLVSGNNGFGYALSVETGKRITIDENWSLTPQAQLIYSNVRFSSFTDQFNGHVSKKRADSLQGRLGISADYQNSWLNDQGTTNRSYVYGIANLYNEFLNGTKVDVSGVSFTNKRETVWAGIGLGGSYNWNDDKYSVYGEGSVNTSLKNFGDSYNYKGTVGFRVKW